MPNVNWNQLGRITQANADIAEPWIVAVEHLQNATFLRITAEGSWIALPGLVAECGPNGLAGLPVQPDRLIVNDCPLGALIAKFGGNAASLGPAAAAAAAAGTAPAEGRPFGVGSYCVAKVPADFIGPLFIGFNSPERPVRVVNLSVVIAGAIPT